jgi:hypothetical protein
MLILLLDLYTMCYSILRVLKMEAAGNFKILAIMPTSTWSKHSREVSRSMQGS